MTDQTAPALPATDGDEFAFLFNCDACAKDITHVVKISCTVCKGTDGEPLDLCIPCFVSGVEVKEHRRDHDYMIVEGLDWPLLEPTWTANEELLLVDGIKLYGIGNWDQVTTHIGTKTKEEVDSHYRTYFCASEDWPIPNMSAVFDKTTSRRYTVRDQNPPLRKPERSCASGPTNHEIQGYMPGREEFEHEFEQDAEIPIKDIVFEDDECPEEIALKCAMLNIYNIALDRRTERKKFVRDRHLTHDFRRVQAQEKKRTKEDRDLMNRIRVFAKLQTASDFEEFALGLSREQRLRQRISELQEFRRMGVTTFAQATEYSREKHNRAQYKAAGLKNPNRPPPIRNPTSSRFNSTTSTTPAPTAATPPSGPPYNPVPGRKTYTPLDISGADGYDLLLPNEQQLCTNIRILPRAYLVIKERLLKFYAESGGLTRKEARALIRIDVHKTQQIYDLFVINGWVQFAGL
ncbi:Transcriptional adapter ada2 [Podochytrium sp. JEL0797]|nr:Transcriptional adapter ada2 [Podochytrium sp. JEL0797]